MPTGGGSARPVSECHVYEPHRHGRSLTWEQEQDDVARWIDSLPKPIAILACNDIRGLQVLDACRRIALPVPERVAVLGVDNDVVLGELSDPPLSSIDQDLERIGYEAASLLDRLMSGESPPPGPVLVEPLGVVSRRSTDAVAIDDPAVAIALRLIRQHACDQIGVDFLADHTNLSRACSSGGSRPPLGRTLQGQIHDSQLERIKQMLVETDLKLDSIARRSGFNYIGYMWLVLQEPDRHDARRVPTNPRAGTVAGSRSLDPPRRSEVALASITSRPAVRRDRPPR